MNGPFYIGATGLRSQEQGLDAVANNIANINTTGYKRTEVRFSELVPPTSDTIDPAAERSRTDRMFSGVTAAVTSRVFTQGDLKETGRPLDVAINGEGFLELMGPNGTSILWRGGALKVNADGQLAAANGMPLKAMISVPGEATELSIDTAGVVRARTSDGEAAVEIGRLDLALAKDADMLTDLGGGLYQTMDPADVMTATPGEGGAGLIVQGAVESSNVQLSDEMVTLMVMQRAYAANAQIVQAGDQLMAIANGLRR